MTKNIRVTIMASEHLSKPPSTPFLLLGGVAIVAGFCGIFVSIFQGMVQREYDHALNSSTNVVESLAADIDKNIEFYDLSMQQAAYGFLRSDVKTLAPELRQMVLFDASVAAKDFGSLRILDANGQIIADSATLNPKQDNIESNRSVVQAASADPELFVGKPAVERDGRYTLGLARRIINSDGKSAGIVVGSVALKYFHDLFRKLHLGPEDSIALLRTDGTLIMRYPFQIDLIGHKIDRSELLTKFSEKPSGRYQGSSGLDNIEKLFVYRQVGSRPLLIVQGTSINGIFESWRSEVKIIAALVSVLSILTLALIFGLTRALKKRHAAEIRLAAMAASDALTGLGNRRNFDDVLEEEWRRAQRARSPLSLILIDVDHFKSYNDIYGHQAGDQALKIVASCIDEGAKRGSDFSARYGGEEFAVILPDADIDGAVQVSERIRTSVLAERNNDVHAKRVPTISLGVASLVPQAGLTPADLIKSADLALYDAKRDGRNRTARSTIIPFPKKSIELATAS